MKISFHNALPQMEYARFGVSSIRTVGKGKQNMVRSLKMDIKIPTLVDTIVSNKGRYYGAGVHNGLMLDETILFNAD